MKKLNILKTIVDLFFIIALITIPIMLFFIGFAIFSETPKLPININGTRYDTFNTNTKLILVASMFSYLLLIYVVYLFKGILREFQKTKVFSFFVFQSFNKMGIMLIISAFLTGIPSFLYPLFSESKFVLEFSMSPFLLMLCFGLFFMILSEIFKIAKQAKEENELTV